MYDYVKRSYGVEPKVGARVRHTETGQFGEIAPEGRSQQHYVMVRFDGRKHADPCHPTALDYNPPETRNIGAAPPIRGAWENR
jgi:hypothetical protein